MNTVKVRNIEIGAGIPKICVPIVGVTREEILAAAENIKSTKADVVEWRVDWYSAHPKKVERKQSRQRLMLN